MIDVTEQIDDALATLTLPRQLFARCDSETASHVTTMARKVFVTGDPRVWWLSLKQPKTIHPYPNYDGPQHISEFIPADQQTCWFIAEAKGKSLPVYDATISIIPAVLNECSFFEYYLVGKQYDWMVIENDHNELIVSEALPT